MRGAVHFQLKEDTFENILSTNRLRTHFQPIVELGDGHLFGYESLSRGPLKTFYESPDVLFGEARRRSLLFQLEQQCQRRLLANLFKRPNVGFYMFVNLEPILLEAEDWHKLPIFQTGKEIDPRNFVIELTERHNIRSETSFKRNLDFLRDAGFRIALDDVGSGYSDLDSIVEFQPEFLKISHRIVKNIANNTLKQRVVSLLLELSENFAFTIAEGIETVEDFETLRQLGVRFGQGFLLARPSSKMTYSKELRLYAIKQELTWSPTGLPQVS